MTQNQLSCRMIQVSNLAYKIKYGQPASEQSQEVRTAIGEIGLIADTLKSVEIGTDACAFAETDAEAILFFRGTLPPWLILHDNKLFLKVVKDWLDDANILLVKGQNLPGRVHNGFLNSLDALWSHIEDFTAGTAKPFHVTGHSKGGGLTSSPLTGLRKSGGNLRAFTPSPLREWATALLPRHTTPSFRKRIAWNTGMTWSPIFLPQSGPG